MAEVEANNAPDAFDRVVAHLPQRWREDGYSDGVETWEEQSAVEKIGFLAGYAAAHNVSVERFVQAAGRTLGLAAGLQFTAEEQWHLRRLFRWAHEDFSDDCGERPHPWPSEIAEQNRNQPGNGQRYDNGKDTGYSM